MYTRACGRNTESKNVNREIKCGWESRTFEWPY